MFGTYLPKIHKHSLGLFYFSPINGIIIYDHITTGST